MVIRKLKRDDFREGIVEVLEEHTTDDVSVRLWNKYFSYVESTQGYEVIVATELTLIVGVLVYTIIPNILFTPQMVMRIEKICVRSGHERRDVPLQLMQHVVNYAQTHAISKVVVTYDPAFLWVYKKVGFQKEEVNMLLYC